MKTVTEQQLKRPRAKEPVLKQILKITGNILFFGVLIAAAVILFFTLQSKLKGEAPAFLGYKIYTVLSGSMEPTLHTGSLIVTESADPTQLAARDIITFKGMFEDPEILTTHRIVAVNAGDPLTFTTRGDANDANDPRPVSSIDVVGKVNITVPYAGYIMEFARTKKGLLVLVIIPGAFIIILEMRKLLKYAIQLDREKQIKIQAELKRKVSEEGSEAEK